MTNHQSKPNHNLTMQQLLLIIFTLLVGSVLCVPNQQQQPSAQHQRAGVVVVSSAADYDKQFLRKALEESNAARSSTDSANATSASSFQCPEQFGYYTDTRDCTKYYVCVFGEVLHESCTGGLRFSRELQTCDWPRNVDCPQQQQQQQTNTSAQTSTSATSVSGSTSTFATTVPTSTTTSGPNNLKQQQQLNAAANAKELPANNNNEDDEEDTSSNSNSNDGDQQDQTLKGSSMVFADEGSDPQQPSFDEAVSPVITSDGAIHLHDGSGGTFSLTPNHRPNVQPQQPQDGPSVDVFVKPLVTQQTPSSGSNNRARAQQSNGGNQHRQQASQTSKLQAATLPDQRSGHQHRAAQQQQQASNNQHNQRSNQQQQNLPQTTAPSFHSFNSNSDEKFSSNSNEQPDENGGESISDLSDESPPNDTVGAQADQESNENQDSETLANNEEDLSSAGGDGGLGNGSGGVGVGQQALPSSGYIPPVMAPNTFRQSSPSPSMSTVAGGRQLSQLLSVNNRQVESSRSSFKPIIFNAPTQVPKKPQVHANNQARSQFENTNLNHQQAGEEARSAAAVANNQRQQHQNNHQQNSIRQNQNLTQIHHHNAQQHQQNTLPAMQNNRQSRMSNQQQFSQSLGESRQSRLLPLSTDQTLSNNVNFNDSSKLIRLQASQFEPLPIVDSGSGGGFPQFPLPSQGSRSQNILFSQPAFSFTGDSNGDGGGNSHNNVPDQPGTHLHFEGSGSRASSNNNHNHNNGGLSHHLSSALPASNSAQLLQQQRRPRPPKRQQIPVGSTAAVSTTAARRPSVNANQLRPTPTTSQPIEFDTPTTTTMTTTTSQPTTNGFLLTTNEGATFIESEETTGPPLPPTTVRMPSFQATTSGQASPSRPIVVPTTINFQQEGLTTSFGPIPPQIATTFATTPPTSALTTVGEGRRFSSAISGDSALASSSLAGAANRAFHAGSHFAANSAGQGQQRAAQLLASSVAPTSPSTVDQTPSSLPAATHITNLNPNANANVNANANANRASASNQDQDQQLAANRYLNSAIDALEAGQPFGTVDYDFDILNDNSTERRNPATANSANSAASASLQPQSNNSSLSSAHSNLNANTRQRQASFRGQDDGENISLTNGHPNGSQIGLSFRPQQQSQGNAQTTSNSRIRVAASGSQQQVDRQRESQAAANAGGQFNQDSFDSAQQQASAPAAPNNQQQQQQQQNSPTKKPRPTNKKITVNHEQAIANNRASTEPAKRPEALFATPTALQTATKCDNRVCRLPDCKCGDTLTPGGLDPKVIPQVILLTFDDAVNDLNWEIYEELFTGRTNPNGCPIMATFYVSHEWTDYGQVQTLYSRGHEMASHSVTHSFGEKFSKSQWFKEVNGQREILNMYGGVKMSDVRGMRAPFLQIGGNKMFEMLYDANFTYDSSMPIFENSPPLWPYTLDYQLAHECMITPCPTKSFPGVWEVGMTMWVDLRGGRCSMGDACSNPADEDGVYEMLMKNFNRHYKSNRAPFGLFYHSAWFNTIHHRRGFLRFMGTVNSLSDVFFTTNWQMLQWMRKPTPIDEINSFEPWQCPAKNDRPPPCFHPSVCNVKSEHGTRFMKTCQPCPANQQYPWVGATGFKGKQAAAGGSG